MNDERLHKMINGEKVYCTPEEEAEIRAEWAKNDAQQKLDEQKRADYKSLCDKFGDIPTFLDKLCKKLNIDPTSL